MTKENEDVMIHLRRGTRLWLKSRKRGGESYDGLIRRLLEATGEAR